MKLHRSGCIQVISRLAFLSLLFLALTSAQEPTSRVFNAPLEPTWNAAVDVATEAFLADRISKSDGRLRLRAGPLRAYSFDVYVKDAGNSKTRVEMMLRTPTTISAVRKGCAEER